MGLKPAYLNGVADDLMAVYAQLEVDITADVVRRIASSKSLTDTARWQIEKANDAGLLNRTAIRKAATLAGVSDDEIKKAFSEGCTKALKADDAIHMKAGAELAPLGSSFQFRQVMAAGVQKTKGVLSNFTMTTARSASNAYIKLMDRAYLQVSSGAFTYDEAIRRAVTQLVSQGITKVAYPSGAEIAPEAAARMSLLTGLNQTTAQLQLLRADEAGCDLVEVTAHAGARPSHAEWQGKVYSRSGASKKYDNFVTATGYGSGGGLCGWNCYHSFYPYYEGISKRTYSDDQYGTKTENSAEYDAYQQTRAYERAVRESKKQVSILDAALKSARSPDLAESLEKQFRQASLTLSNRRVKLNSFMDAHGIIPSSNRIFVPNYGASTSSKAAWAAKKAQ